MKLFLTGAAGFMGGAVARAAVADMSSQLQRQVHR